MKRLFSGIKIGNMKLKNRIVLLSMHLGYAQGGIATEQLIRFYEERAKGGAGLLIAGGAHIHPHGSGGLHFMAIDDDKYIPDLKKFTGAIRAGGAKSALQLFHSGRYAFSMLTGEKPVSASDVRSPLSGDTPRPLTIDEIKEMVALFTKAAKRAKEAGFDSIEVNGSTGYLVSQFLSPFTNLRTDEYGGSLENRMRFAKEVVQSIKKELGDDYPLIFRLSFDDYVEGGNGLAEAKLIAVELEKTGVDCLDMQVGWHESKVPTSAMLVPRAAFAYLSREIKKLVTIPVIAANRINNPVLAEELLMDSTADLIGMGRALVADPQLPDKAKDGRAEEIRPCIACNQGCMDGVFMGRPSTCLVNPAVSNEADFKIIPAKKKKKVMVIGGGPGGMVAARILSIRGHHVTLYERQNSLGGQLNLCGQAPDRSEFKSFLNYLVSEMGRLEVKVVTGEEATAQTVEDNSPDAVIVATGARQDVPPIPGVNKSHVHTAESVLTKKAPIGEKVVIIGGGHIGCEVALLVAPPNAMPRQTRHFLVSYGALDERETMEYGGNSRSVTIVEVKAKIAGYYGRTSRFAVMQGLRKYGVEMMKNTKCIEIKDKEVVVEQEGDQKTIEADTVVITSGYVEEKGLYLELKDKVAEIYLVGDAKKLMSCQYAVIQAATMAREI